DRTHDLEQLVLERALPSVQRTDLVLERLQLAGGVDRTAVELTVDLVPLLLDQRHLVFEARLLATQLVSAGLDRRSSVGEDTGRGVEGRQLLALRQGLPAMAELVSRGVVLLEVEELVEDAHAPPAC